jgi:5S rRNA maturation endonuclease (ribonuclease M5)
MNIETVIVQLRRRGHKVRRSGIRNEIWMCCPFCTLNGKTSDTEFKLGVNVRNGKGHCFRCGWRSRTALTHLQVQGSTEVPTEKPATRKPVELPKDFHLLTPNDEDDWFQLAWKYCVDRGMSEEQILRHKVGLSLEGRFRGRVVFPIYEDDTLVGLTGRTLMKRARPPWLHSENLTTVYWAGRSGKRTVTVTEGVFDALRLERFLSPKTDTMALLGTHLSEAKMRAFKDYREVILWLDPDRAGINAVTEIGGLLIEREKTVSVVSSNRDPSELDERTIRTCYKEQFAWAYMRYRLMLGRV